ncbi:hypothetical protein SAMN05216436_13134 [bacterium A37T11]|nr:hypothetical protein SAMN05216436_13134 [bacterium A37T11]
MDNVPNNSILQGEVFMNHVIPEPLYFPPGYIRILILIFLRYFGDHFAYYREIMEHGML